MKRVLVVSCAVVFSCLPLAQALCADWSGVESVFGRKGMQQGIIFSIAFPRADLHVVADSITLEPSFAVSSWVGFRSMGSNAMLMGDLALLEKEVDPVMRALTAGGLEITAVHNHLIGEQPRLMYMHFGGRGDAVKLATLVKSALALTGTPLSEPPPPGESATWGNVESVMGFPGVHQGPVLHFTVPRIASVQENSMDIPPALGVASNINFQKVGEKAAVTGDLVLISSEVSAVVKSLLENGIAVTALHSHMLYEVPRLYFLHFWAVGDPEKLARALRGAMEWTASARK